jgi:hypothetical protein
VRRGTWRHHAAGIAGRQSCNLPRLSKHGPPWHTCHQMHGVCTFCLEMSWQGHGSHVPRLPAVPEWENPQAACSSSPRDPCARTQVFSRARGPVGPLPASSDGHVYLLTIIDRSTRWMEAVPLRNMDTITCTDTLIANWVAHFVMPATVTTDKGVVGCLHEPRYQARAHHCLLPSKQQDG